MKIRTIIAFLMLLSGSLITFNGVAEESSGHLPPITNTLKVPANHEFDQNGYYTYRYDFRKCISPVCGGIFVKAVNQKLTRCADGSRQEECYVATVNNKKNIDTGSAALLKGRIKSKIYQDFGNLGAFELKAAYFPATPAVGEGQFVGLENNGIVCITTPCFSADQYLLNRNKLRVITGIDLTEVGASEENENKALAILSDGDVLIASGVNKQVEEVDGTGITFVAKQFYLPIKPGGK
jgi:hypothetical protein